MMSIVLYMHTVEHLEISLTVSMIELYPCNHVVRIERFSIM